MTEDLSIQWKQCQDILSDNLTGSVYRTWFAPMVPVSYADNTLVLQVKSQYIVEYVEENYIEILSKVIFRVFGRGTRLEYKVLIDSTSGAAASVPSSGADMERQRQGAMPVQQARVVNDNFETYLNPDYTFDTFVQGESNKLAWVSGSTVSRMPGKTAFNPLFIYGGSGVGKTHLANAIGNQAKALNPNLRVLYVSANTFKIQFMDAVKTNNITNFLNFYQSVDMLIMDDIQFLSGSEEHRKPQDTFFHIFNYLQQSQKQLILTSDRSPLQLVDIQDRLLSRFKWGLSAEITRPDFSLRRKILLSKMHRDGIELQDDIVDFIAQNVNDGVRDLEGILASLMAYSTLADEQINMPLVEEVVARVVQITPTKVDAHNILDTVCNHYNVPESAVVGASRQREIAQARHMAIYLCSQYTDCSLTEIGSLMGKRTHATVLHSIATIQQQLDVDPVTRNRLKQLEEIILR